MYINSPLSILPVDLLRTKILWVTHDLDKTINSQTNFDDFKKIASTEAARLKKHLDEWAKRNLPEENVIFWAKNVFKEYEILFNEWRELYKTEFNYNSLDPEAVYNVIKTRRSIRRWLNKSVPEKLIKKMLQAANWAPSACNRQSCRYIVLRDNFQKQLIVNLREKWLQNAPVLIFIGTDKRNYLPEEINYVPYMDASMATQNMLLMAHSLGLGAVVVKTAGWDINVARSKGYSQKIAEMNIGLNLPSFFIPVSLVAIGYAVQTPKAPARLSYNKVVFHEKYNNVKQEIISVNIQNNTKIIIKQLIISILKKVAKKAGLRAYFSLH